MLTWRGLRQFSMLVLLLAAAQAQYRAAAPCPRLPVPSNFTSGGRMAFNPAAAAWHPQRGWVAMYKVCGMA